jgi:hypothetical protein
MRRADRRIGSRSTAIRRRNVGENTHYHQQVCGRFAHLSSSPAPPVIDVSANVNHMPDGPRGARAMGYYLIARNIGAAIYRTVYRRHYSLELVARRHAIVGKIFSEDA